MFDSFTINDLSDGLHPNEIGHQKMSTKIKEKIDTLI
jgi:lysophospholipase L1-like esterase